MRIVEHGSAPKDDPKTFQTTARPGPTDDNLEQPDSDDNSFDAIKALATGKAVGDLAAQNKIVLFGRKPTGAYFRIPGLDQLVGQLTRMLDRQLASVGESTMEEQYEELKTNVELIAGGKSNFAKSLLITGAPASGKTFTITQTLKTLGLKENQDYLRVGGSVTDADVYKKLIEWVNGLIVFDDCDSVVETKEGKNMMKNALDTTPVREVSKGGSNMINTAALAAHEREEYVNALSNALRFKETEDDIAVIEMTLHRMKLLKKALKNFEADKRREAQHRDRIKAKLAGKGLEDQSDEDENGDFISTGGTREEVILEFARSRLPNMFDFKGRIIFISNMRADQWDAAIRTRALHQDMSFKSGEMLDFIEKIADKINTPGLDLKQKMEVLHYLRELWQSGQLHTAINFRIVQQAWDLRLVPGWKKKIARW